MYCHKVTDKSINSLKEASTADQSKLYFKLRLKHRISVQNAWFNQQCLRNNVFPKYTHVKCNSSSISARKAVHSCKITWLKEEARKWFRSRDNLLLHIKVLHSELAYKLHPIEFDIFDDNTRLNISQIIHKIYLTQSKKLKNLIENKKYTKTPDNTQQKTFYDRFINISSTNFTESEKKLLGKGPKYNPNFNIKNTTETLISEIESATKNISDSNIKKEKIKHIMINTKNTACSSKEQLTIASIQSKIKENNLIITKADKGNSIIALDKNQYIEKVNDFLEKENPLKLKKDPTDKIQKQLKTLLNETLSIVDERERFKIINQNPLSPKLYGLIKIHKENSPIRPVVSYSNSPLKNLATHLNTVFREITQFNPKHSTKNSIDLTNKLKNISIPNNALLVSFDVTNMFSNIPNKDCLRIIDTMLRKNNINITIQQDILKLFEFCITGNYFQFNNQFFKQRDGLAMGSPLSPLLAEIFMSELENNFLKTNHAKNILFWFRYVDDILVCFHGNDTELNSTLNHLNNIHPNIKFTLEKEIDNKINFLDVTILKNRNKLEFDIFRKPTFSDVTIPADSIHPNSHKLAAYRSMIHRAFNIPLSKNNLKKELDTIKNIALNNGFQPKIINNLICRKQKQITFSLIYPIKEYRERKSFTPLTYFGPISDKISQVLTTEKTRIALKPAQKLSHIFFNAKDKINKHDKSGVYRLNCRECNSCYIGQTGRNFKIRFAEHNASYRLKNEKSHFAKHFLETDHSFPNIDCLSVLHMAPKGPKLNFLESLEIYRHSKNDNINLLNGQIDVGNSVLYQLL